jgi:hypothetical protein
MLEGGIMNNNQLIHSFRQLRRNSSTTIYNRGHDMRQNSNALPRLQGSQAITAKVHHLNEKGKVVPRVHDVSEDVILHDAYGNNVVRISWNMWFQFLDLAESNGWDPMGTNPPSLPPVAILELAPSREERWEAWEHEHEETWSGTYLSQDFPEVTWEDACAMAKALKTAPPMLDDNEFAQTVKKFISFCESSGGFTIGRSDGEYWAQEPWTENDKMRTALH